MEKVFTKEEQDILGYDYNGRPLGVSAFVHGCLDGTDYDRGQIETHEAGIDKLTVAMAGLLERLHRKGVLTIPEIRGILP